MLAEESRHTRSLSIKHLMNFFFPQKVTSTSIEVNTPANQLSQEKRRERCHELMKKVSNSYRHMISKLDREANHVTSIYYMLLRGMDTIEDDMTIPMDKKIPLLRDFHKIIFQRGWTFNESGPDEKHRQLLVEFDVIIEEFLTFSEEIQDIIANTTKMMGNGMADYILIREKSKYYVVTIDDYEKYCFYACATFCLGFGRIMNVLNPELPNTDSNYESINSISLFIQKLDIMKDFREDFHENRIYWPSTIWSQYVADVSELLEPNKREMALNCQSAMTLNALSHIVIILEFLNKLNDPAMFEIIALIVAVEFSYLVSMYRNYDVFSKKVTYQCVSKVVSQCKNLENVCKLFRSNVKKIMKKNDPKDIKSYEKLNTVCKEIDQWCDNYLSMH